MSRADEAPARAVGFSPRGAAAQAEACGSPSCDPAFKTALTEHQAAFVACHIVSNRATVEPVQPQIPTTAVDDVWSAGYVGVYALPTCCRLSTLRQRECSNWPLRFSPVANPYHEDQENLVANLVEDAVVPNPDAPDFRW